jgi:two-component system response regulator NreC
MPVMMLVHRNGALRLRSNKEIANRLNLSLHTVETHRWRIMEKMDLHSTAELVLSAVRRGLVT